MSKNGVKFLKYDKLEVACEYAVTDCRGTEVSFTEDSVEDETSKLPVKVTTPVPNKVVGYSTLFNGQFPSFPKPRAEGRI